MYDSQFEPKPLLPALEPLYRRVVPLSWLLIRCSAGVILFVHGYPKLGHVAAVVGSMNRIRIVPAVPFAYLVILIETVGAVCVTIGFFTRLFAAACAIELAVLTFDVFWPNGFGWSHRGYEYMLMWGVVMFAIALRGGGPYSVDRLIGRAL